jgi:predicted Rossmann fold nucleotide-binding protein DprA/Smf involved in DNA uptake
VVLDATDLLAAIGLAEVGCGKKEVLVPPGLSTAQTSVWRSLHRDGPGDPETISRRTGLSAASLLEALSLLELAGYIERDGEGYVISRGGGLAG